MGVALELIYPSSAAQAALLATLMHAHMHAPSSSPTPTPIPTHTVAEAMAGPASVASASDWLLGPLSHTQNHARTPSAEAGTAGNESKATAISTDSGLDADIDANADASAIATADEQLAAARR